MLISGESLLILTIGVHHVDFKVPIPIRREDYLRLCINDCHQQR